MRPRAEQQVPVELRKRPRRRLWLRLAIVGALLLAGVGHWAWHYRPGVRALPRSGHSEVAALWASPEADLALWLAYPHQNLGALERRVGNLDLYLADIGALLQAEPVRLPRFGPFRLPPARELVAVEVPAEPRWRAAAQVYPGIAAVARGAGRLTANPWLGGGRVSADGNMVRIAWRGNLWSFGDWSPATSASSTASGDQVIGRLRLERARGEWPPGDYDLLVDEGTLWLAEHGAARATLEGSVDWPNLQGIPLLLREVLDDGQRLLLFFSDGEGTLPSVASVSRATERFDLPGERFFTRLGADVLETTVGDWTVTAYSEADIERARRRLDGIAADPAPGRSARLAAGPVGRLSRRLGEALVAIPIIGEAEAGRWLSLARLLEPLGEDGVVELSLAEPVFLRIAEGSR